MEPRDKYRALYEIEQAVESLKRLDADVRTGTGKSETEYVIQKQFGRVKRDFQLLISVMSDIEQGENQCTKPEEK